MFSDEEGWVKAFETLHSTIVPILDRIPAEQERLYPKIPNIVTTVSLLPPGYRLPLHEIARRLPNAQFAPNLFAAVRITLRDNLSQTTALLFSPGSMVVVGSRTEQHALYWSRIVAVMISSTRFPVYNKTNNVIEMHLLADYMRFENFKTHNYVGYGDLGLTLDLSMIYQMYSCCTDRFEGLFPGLTCRVWLTKDYTCHCTSKANHKNRKSCKCILSVLLFETGKVVLPGCKSVAIMNSVFYRVRKAIDAFINVAKPTLPLTRIMNFELPVQVKRAKRSDDYELEPYKPQSMGITRKSTLPPIIRFALDDRLAEVAHMLSMVPECYQDADGYGQTAKDRLLLLSPADQMPNYEAILNALKHAEGA